MEIQKLYNTDLENNNTLSVDWFFGNITRLQDVPYLHRKFYDGSLPSPKLEDIDNFLSQLREHYGNRNIMLRTVNGELSLHSDRDKIMSILFKHGITLAPTVCSDFSNWWADNSMQLGFVILNFHPGFSSLNDMIKLKKNLIDNGKFVITNVNVTPDNFHSAQKSIKLIDMNIENRDRFFLNYRLNFQDVNQRPLSYTDDQLAAIESFKSGKSNSTPAFTVIDTRGNEVKMNFNTLLLSYNYFEGYKCSVGVDQIAVTATGQVRRSWCGVDKALGKISGEIAFPTDPIVCNRERCFNGFDIMAKKEK